MVARQRRARTVRRQTLSDYGGHASAVKASLLGTASVLHALPGAAALSGVSRQRRLWAFLIVNVAFMVVEFGYGYLNHSLGMLSDAVHMLLDNAAVVIGLAAEQHAAKCARGERSSDPTRVRVLAGFANAVILLFVALNIVLEAGVHLMGGGHDVTTHRLLPVSIVGLLVNIVGLLFVHEAHNHHHHAQGTACSGCTSGADPNMRAIFLHVLADTLGSVAVIASTLAVQRLHWHWADPMASVAIAGLIVIAVWPLVQQSAAQLLESPSAQPSAHSLATSSEEPAEKPAAKAAAAAHAAPKSEPKAEKKQLQAAHKAAPASATRKQPAGLAAEAVRRSPRRGPGQPAWLSDMVA